MKNFIPINTYGIRTSASSGKEGTSSENEISEPKLNTTQLNYFFKLKPKVLPESDQGVFPVIASEMY